MKAQDLDNTSPLSLKDVYFVWPIPLVGIHKKCKRTNPKNYRPIPPLSFKKVVEASDKIPTFLTSSRISSWPITRHAHYLAQVVYMSTMAMTPSTSLSPMQLHLTVCGISASPPILLRLIQDCLRRKSLRVAVNSHTLKENPTAVSAPQGTVPGLLLWNIFWMICFAFS